MSSYTCPMCACRFDVADGAAVAVCPCCDSRIPILRNTAPTTQYYGGENINRSGAGAKGAPRIFCSYAHRDMERVMPIFTELRRANVPIWYDDNIRAGFEWEKEIIENLSAASAFLFFVTKNSLVSQNCMDELYEARKQGKKFINIVLEDIDFSHPDFQWFSFRYSRYQMINAYSMTSTEVVRKILSGLE